MNARLKGSRWVRWKERVARLGAREAAAGEVKRWSAGRKKQVVLRMLRGKSVDALSRELAAPIVRLEQWRERALVFAGDAYTWFRSEFASGETPQTEIIVTTSVSDGNRYLARSTSVYYAADTDKALYQASLPASRIQVRGGE